MVARPSLLACALVATFSCLRCFSRHSSEQVFTRCGTIKLARSFEISSSQTSHTCIKSTASGTPPSDGAVEATRALRLLARAANREVEEELEENDGSLGPIRALRWAVFRGKAALSMSEVIAAAAEAQGCPKSTLVRDFWQADKADALAWSEQCARHRWEC